jgi:hypothetical protein
VYCVSQRKKNLITPPYDFLFAKISEYSAAHTTRCEQSVKCKFLFLLTIYEMLISQELWARSQLLPREL